VRYLRAFVASGMVLFGLTANAQYQPRYNRDYDRNNYYRDYRDEDRAYARNQFLNRLQADLDRVASTAVPFNGDAARIARARDRVNELRRNADSAYLDRRDIDMAIGAIQMVLNRNHVMSETDREMLANDVSRMREFEARLALPVTAG
jgi:hypothetical protein